MLVSIVANFYNSGKFIPKLLETVAAQTFTDWELLCIVDASPGNDEKVLRRHIQKLGIGQKVRVLVNPVNLGISQSKKRGIDEAQGKYITFIDGDDFLAPEALERLVAPAVEHDLDVVVMNYYRYFPVFRKLYPMGLDSKEIKFDTVMQKEELFDKCMVNFLASSFFPYPFWGKLYKASVLKTLPYEYPAAGKVFAEDKWFNFVAFQHMNSGCFISYHGYYWRWGGISMLRSVDEWTPRHEIDDIIDHHTMIMDFIDRHGYTRGLAPYAKNRLDTFYSYFSRHATSDKDSCREAVAEEMRQVLANDAFSDVPEILGTHTDMAAAIAAAIATGDCSQAFSICRARYKAGRKLRTLHRLEDIILMPLRHL